MERVAARHIQVDEIDLRLYYELHRGCFTSPERRTARHILITLNDRFEENRRDRVLARMQRLRERLGGRPSAVARHFPDLARRHSECPTALEGGRLGEVRRASSASTCSGASVSTPNRSFPSPRCATPSARSSSSAAAASANRHGSPSCARPPLGTSPHPRRSGAPPRPPQVVFHRPSQLRARRLDGRRTPDHHLPLRNPRLEHAESYRSVPPPPLAVTDALRLPAGTLNHLSAVGIRYHACTVRFLIAVRRIETDVLG